jgi:hypothetical protein
MTMAAHKKRLLSQRIFYTFMDVVNQYNDFKKINFIRRGQRRFGKIFKA